MSGLAASLVTSLTTILENPATQAGGQSALSALLTHTSSTGAMVNQVQALLLQLQQNPQNASMIATSIIALPGVPSAVISLAGGLPEAAKDPTSLSVLSTQITAALTSANSLGSLHGILSIL